MSERALRWTLLIVGVYQLVTGLLAMIAPDTFFDQIGQYGSENSHYVGDVGAFVAAAGVGLLLAVNRPSWRAPLLWVGAVWYGLHALNHLFDIGEARSDARGVLDTALLALGAAGSAYLAQVSERLRRPEAVPFER
jgi:predicted anti-sigma-YlaC factor YlaD